ncbi:hypothetical protein HBA92_17455 [Ochrobactrum sp. MR28]|nr:hypothetical protein [Ochrobactrum sp. MR28]MBX8817983.1 hypothetical protein [Ochrobactrum sp. MR31]
MNKLDLPLSHLVDDHFDRSDYARKLGDLIYGIDDLPSGYVIGIEGKWGSGKTSIVNMVNEHLEHLQMLKKNKYYKFRNENNSSDFSIPDLERISPRFKLVKHSFNYETCNYSYLSKQHFLNTACLDPDSEDVDDLYKYFCLYNDYINNPNIIFVKFSPWMMPSGAALAATFLAELTRSTKGHLGSDLQSMLQVYAAKVASLAPIAGKLAITEWAGSVGLIEAIGTFIGGIVTRQKSIEDVKASIEIKLRKLKDIKIVVVIDDLDRLPPAESSEMMNLIKGLGHLPNVLYLLTYDQVILGQQLEGALGLKIGQGEEYLQKIIQLRRSLPRFTKEHFIEIVDQTMAQYTAVADENTNRRLTYAWSDYVAKVMNTPREAQLLINSIKNFDENIFDYIDTGDMFLLQAIYLKDIKLYAFIRDNVNILSIADIENPRNKDDFIRLLNDINCNKDNIYGAVLSILFPNVSNYLSINQFLHEPKLATRQRRLHVDSASDLYFNIVTSKNQISKILIDSILDSDKPEKELRRYILWIEEFAQNKSLLRIDLIRIIEDHFDSEETFNIVWLNTLLNISDILIKHTDNVARYIGGGDNLERLSRIILKNLDRNDSKSTMIRSVVDVIEQQPDISLACSVLRLLLPKDKLEIDLQERIIKRIIFIAFKDQMWNQHKPMELLYLWRKLVGTANVNTWLKLQTRNFKDLMQFFLFEDQFNPGIIRIINWDMDDEMKFMFVEKAREILRDENNDDYLVAQNFLQAFINTQSDEKPHDV